MHIKIYLTFLFVEHHHFDIKYTICLSFIKSPNRIRQILLYHHNFNNNHIVYAIPDHVMNISRVKCHFLILCS